jgi:phosphonate transport system substrate-binding protein
MFRLSYYPWITQNVAPSEVDRNVRLFADVVSAELRKLGVDDPVVQVLPPLDVPQQVDQIVAGGADIALMNPLGFVFAHRRSGNVDVVAVALRIIDGTVGSFYFAQLYTSKKTAIRRLEQVAGKSIGYGLAYSTSNFLVPAAMLREAGVHPTLGIARLEFLKGHEIIARAVYEGKIDVGAGHDGVIVDLANQPGYGDAAEVLLRIGRSAPIPSDPVAVNIPDAERHAVIQQALIAAGATQQGKDALKIFWGNTQGLASTDAKQYDVLDQALQRLRLEEADLLPRR